MLEFKNIRKSFSGVEVLHGVSFSVDRGKIVALVGENGAGKSTLMKILAGIIPEYSGTVRIGNQLAHFKNPRDAERAGVSIIHQELNLVPDLSIGENIFLGKEPVKSFGRLDFRKLYRESDRVLKEFDFPFSSKTKLKNLTIGWQQMVEIAKALRLDSQIIIMDEPTSALSENEISRLFEKMQLLKSRGKTILFITHRLKEVFEVADEIAVLRDGLFLGKYPINEITREELINLMIGREIPDRTTSFENEAKAELLRVVNLEASREEAKFLSQVNFSLRKGEILGVAGLLGAGRTELLKFLYGELKARYSGKILFGNVEYQPRSASDSISHKIVYLPEDRKTEAIFPDASLRFNSSISALPRISKFGFVKTEQEKNAVNEQFQDLKVVMKSVNQKIPTLSGGNQQKVLLSRVLLLQPRLLLLDEPTRGIDVGSKAEIYSLIARLASRGAGVIITSSEIPELLRVCHRILVLSQGKQTALLNVPETNPREILSYAFKQE